MQLFAILGVLIMSLVILLGAAGHARKPVPTKPDSPPKTAVQTTAKQVQSMSRAEIEEMLRKIETSKAPKSKMGAMCYSTAPPPARAEYVCPKCGEKTLYAAKDWEDADKPSDRELDEWSKVRFIQWDLPACRRELEAIKKASKLSVTLDESSFCKKCQPKAKKHDLTLTITYKDGKKHIVPSVEHSDMLLLRDFLKGQLTYETFNESTVPLKDSLPRLRKLLGMTKEKETKPKEEPKKEEPKKEELKKEELKKEKEVKH